MQCGNCGTEIADKAIVCYRCGTATTDPVRRPAPIAPRRSPLPWVLVAVVLFVLGAYLFVASQTAADPEPFQLAAGLCAGGGIALLLRTLWRRR